MNMRLLLLLLFGSVVMYTSCRSTSAPIDSLAARVTENTSKDQILFRLVIDEADPAKDYFEIDSKDDKVLITGNSDLSLATGLNWYLKYVAGIHLSWNNPSQKLPEVLPLPQKKIRQTTAMKNRYYLNYCTYSYSMAFWDWERWEKEIDWMAMHGINMPLSITGMEVVWYNLLKRIGYTTEEVNEFISGPAFMAWWQMNNLEGWGGPNPDSWYRQQEALQKKIIARMRELGIEPVFPGYAGMVPRNIGEKLGYQIADPGKWCGFPRPAFLSTEDEHFDSFAAMYYEELEKLYGKAKYYSMDPFHEGGNTEGVDLAKAGTSIMGAMKKANPEAIILAEHYGDPSPWLDGSQWDTVMNYDAFMEPVSWFLTGMEKHSDMAALDMIGDSSAFFGAMTDYGARFTMPSAQVAMNELSNHDHSRFLTRTNKKVGRTAFAGPRAADMGVNTAVMRQAVVMQMTWVGAPTLYYGDEAGVCGWTDPDNRRSYPWGREDNELIRFHKEMIRIHKACPVLTHGSLKFLEQRHNVLSYGRFSQDEQMVVAFNNDLNEQTITLSVWQVNVPQHNCKMERLMLTHAQGYTTEQYFTEVHGGKIELTLPPLSGIVLRHGE